MSVFAQGAECPVLYFKFRSAARHGYLCLGLVIVGLAVGVARAQDDSVLTGGDSSAGQPVVKKVAQAKHKKSVAKKTGVPPATTAQAAITNEVTSPAVGADDVMSPAASTNAGTSPAIPAATNAMSVGAGPAGVAPKAGSNDGRVATLLTTDLRDFDADPPAVRRLLTEALGLTTLNLSYKYGSSDPQNGGMDCSGTIYYLLTQAGIKDVPRDASEMYRWVWTDGRFQSVVSPNPDGFELTRLKPGDLLFWSGTYRVDRDPPITHVMIYLGVNRATGRRVMAGASEGRRFNEVSRYGVSVFDFTMPRMKASSTPFPAPGGEADLQARFVGYGSVPGLENGGNTAQEGDGRTEKKGAE